MTYRTTAKIAERKEAHRNKLLSVAIRMFGQYGYHQTTVPEIVAASGSSTGSFYFYFKNKEDVFAAALEDLGRRISAALNAAIASESDPLQQMRAAVNGLILFLANHPEEARILIIESSGLGGRLQQIRREIIDSHSRGVEKALSQLSSQLSSMNTEVVAHCWVGAVHEAVYHWLELPPENRIKPEVLAGDVARFNLRGIGAPQPQY